MQSPAPPTSHRDQKNTKPSFLTPPLEALSIQIKLKIRNVSPSIVSPLIVRVVSLLQIGRASSKRTPRIINILLELQPSPAVQLLHKTLLNLEAVHLKDLGK